VHRYANYVESLPLIYAKYISTISSNGTQYEKHIEVHENVNGLNSRAHNILEMAIVNFIKLVDIAV